MPTPIFYRLRPERREYMLAQAVEAFSRNVYEDVSIRSVVKAMGISTGSFYRYFTSKEHLYIFLVDEMLVRFWADIGVDIGDVNNHASTSDIDRLLPGQSRFWRSFFDSTPEILRKYYFRVEDNKLYDRFLSGVQRLDGSNQYNGHTIGLTAFLLNVLNYVIMTYREICGLNYNDDELFIIMRDMVVRGFNAKH